MSTIFFLVKFCDKKSYADDLLQGKVYFNRLSNFKENKLSETYGRLDRYEGATAWLQPGNLRLELNGMDLSDDLAGPLTVQMNWLNYLHIFCMHAAYSSNLDMAELDNIDIEDLRRELTIPNDCFSLGEHAVVVTNVPKFIKRMEVAANAVSYRFTRGLVKYYDPETFHGQFQDVESIFWKRDVYSFQREFRFLIDSRSMDDHPRILDIGNIEDITLQFKSNELNGEKFLGGEMSIA